MVSKKHPKATASKISSKADLATSSKTLVASKSSILQSAFTPSRYQLPWFASVIQAIGVQHLRIHDTATGCLRCHLSTPSKTTITCLDWGSYGNSHSGKEPPSKKRKRDGVVNGAGSDKRTDVVVAYGTNTSEIKFYSPAKAEIVGALEGIHTQGIRVFRFFHPEGKPAEGWSIGGDGKLVQWDLRKGVSVRSITTQAPFPSALCPLQSGIVYASHTAYLWNLDQDRTTSFPASVRPVHSIICSSPKLSQTFSFLTVADSDRHITAFSSRSGGSVGDLRTEDDVVSMALYTRDTSAAESTESTDTPDMRPQQVLLVVNREGALEVFPSPFDIGNTARGPTSDQLKSRMKQRTRKAAAVVKLIRPDKASTPVPLLNASFQGNEIIMVWAEGGVNLVFDRLKFLDEEDGNLLVDGLIEIVKAKSGSGIEAVEMNGVKDMGRSHVDESHALVVNGGDRVNRASTPEGREVIDISSGEESESEASSMAGEETVEATAGDNDVQMQERDSKDEDSAETPARNEPSTEVLLIETANKLDPEPEEPEEPEEPSFGDLIRANASEPIDVQATFGDPHKPVVAPNHEGAVALPSGMSLSTVLTQSLRTDDVTLLETCLHVRNLHTVRATIERLDSALAASLLQKLAERLHSRPGRAGSLMVWIQWTLVAHGGFIARQPAVMKQLASLYRVVQERANGLQPLLALKGKLDMLEAQMNLRKRLQAQFRARHAADEDGDDQVIYVEGQENSDPESEPANFNNPRQVISHRDMDGSHHGSSGENDQEDDGHDAEDEMQAVINGAGPEVSSDESDSDDEASSTDQDSDDGASEDEINHDSIDTSASEGSLTHQSHLRSTKAAKLSNGVGARHRRKTRD